MKITRTQLMRIIKEELESTEQIDELESTEQIDVNPVVSPEDEAMQTQDLLTQLETALQHSRLETSGLMHSPEAAQAVMTAYKELIDAGKMTVPNLRGIVAAYTQQDVE